jgi:fatty-acyl-CoA synthase
VSGAADARGTAERARTVVRSTMQDVPLSIATLVRYGTRAYANSEVVSYDGTRTTRSTLGEVGARAGQLAWALRDALDVRVGEPVATLMWNIQPHLEAYLAVPAMGAVLHTLNARYTTEQIAFTARHAGDRVILVDATLLGRLLAVLPALGHVEHVVVVGDAPGADLARLASGGPAVHHYEELLAGRPADYPWPELPEQSPALMCYTSGTTGDPKGVVYSHRSTCLVSMQMCMGDYLGLSQRDRAIIVVPMFHTNSWNFPFAALMVGAAIILPNRYVQAEHLARLITEERPTVAAGVPTIWSDLLDYARQHAGTDLSSLRSVVVGGSACPRPLMEAYEAEFGVRLLHGWGMTEMSPIGTIASPAGDADDEASWEFRMSQGRFVCNVQARLEAPDGTIAPSDGESVGEVQVRGPWITGAYHKQSDASGFVDGWLRTGDIGTITPDGVLRLRDRAKDVIKSGGQWISSLELEQALQAHPAVSEAAVIGVADHRWGERPLAIVNLRAGARASDEDLARYLAARVERWQVPERWAQCAPLPRTSVGKVDKVALRTLHAGGGVAVRTIEVPRS